MRTLLLLLLCLATITTHAGKMVNIKDEDNVIFPIAKQSLNHIKVANERIHAVRGLDNQFDFIADEVDGSIFIVIDEQFKGKEIHLFLSTEQGHHYGLTLIPTSISPQSIVLQWEPIQAAPKKRLAMKEFVVKLKKVQDQLQAPNSDIYLDKNISLKKMAVLDEENFHGERFEIHNHSRHPKNIDPRYFTRQGAVAVGLEKEKLMGHEIAPLYLVFHKDNNHG